MDAKKWIINNTIHRIIGGSRLYGTHRPDSDYDIRGVCMTPPNCLLGLTGFDQYESTSGDYGEDIVIYGLRKFAVLALDNNPNILDILCAPLDKWLIDKTSWKYIYVNRGKFLSQRLRHTFSGYAISQLKRLKGHHEWLVNPPSAPPKLENFGGHLESDKKGGQYKVFENDAGRGKYEKADRDWKQYERWLRERNPARAELEKKYGYDTKYAAHLVRLMVKCQEALSTGEYSPVLEGKDLLYVLDVLSGKYTYEDIILIAADMDDAVNGMDSVLQWGPDREFVEDMVMEIHYDSLRYLY